MEKDFTITRLAWHTRRKGNEDRRDAFVAYYKAFVTFLQSNRLTTRVLLETDQQPDDDFVLRKSDLTEEGFQVVKAGYDKWLRSVVDKRKDASDVSILEKAIADLRRAG
jgi:hypothetical protein